MAVTGWRYPGTNSGSNWMNLSNTRADGGGYASWGGGYQTETSDLWATNFDFGAELPANYSVQGVEMQTKAQAYGCNTGFVRSLFPLFGSYGDLLPATPGYPYGQPLESAPTFSTYTYGGSTFTSGGTLTKAIVEDPAFGFYGSWRYYVEYGAYDMIQVDFMRMRIYYTEVTKQTDLAVKDGGVWKTVDPLGVKDGGTWKEPVKFSVRDGGVWKKIYGTEA